MIDILIKDENNYNRKCLFDSDIIIDILKNNIHIIEFIKKLKSENSYFFYSPVSKAEVYSGAFINEIDNIDLFFNQFSCIHITDSIGKQAGLFLNKYRLSDNISLGDSLIAATAYYYDLYLLTQNIRHYPMPEIRVIKP